MRDAFLSSFLRTRDPPIWRVSICIVRHFTLYSLSLRTDVSSLQIIQLICLESTYIHVNASRLVIK